MGSKYVISDVFQSGFKTYNIGSNVVFTCACPNQSTNNQNIIYDFLLSRFDWMIFFLPHWIWIWKIFLVKMKTFHSNILRGYWNSRSWPKQTGFCFLLHQWIKVLVEFQNCKDTTDATSMWSHGQVLGLDNTDKLLSWWNW